MLPIGLLSIALSALRTSSADRTPVWFGIFVCLYGIRLSGFSELIQPLAPEIFWVYLGNFITYVIITPFSLCIASLLGPGWKNTLRLSWQAAAIYALLTIMHDLIRQQPGAASWLNPYAVFTFAGIATVHAVVYWWQGKWPRELRVVLLGGLIFIVAASYQTLGGEVPVEPFAMLVFMTTVGYMVARRMIVGERKLAEVSRELELAREIQQSILPRELPSVEGLHVAASYLPMSAIGGDFYDFETGQESCLGVIVADVSGHGVPAALVASMVKMGFVAEIERLDRPGLALANINRMLCGRFEGAYVTASCAFIDPGNHKVRYASAAHPAPMLRRKDGSVEHLDRGGLLLAFDPDAEYGTAEVGLCSGDRLVLYSDGLVEAQNEDEIFFEKARLEQLLSVSAGMTPERLIDHVMSELRRWVGPERPIQDDVTMVVIDVT